MPKLLVFAPCEKVVIAQDDNNPTLIAVLTELNGEFELAPNTAPDPKLMLPMQWTTFSLWSRIDGDEGKTFVQTIRLVSPSGVPRIDTSHEFQMIKGSHRVTVKIVGIPAHEPGTWSLELLMREKGAPEPRQPMATYPLNVHFINKTQPATQS